MTPGKHLDPESIEQQAQGQAVAGDHLSGCAECRGAVAHAHARRRILLGLQPPELDEFAFSRVERRLFEEKAAPRRFMLWWPALGLAAAFAALAIFVLRSPAPAPVPAREPMVVQRPVPPPRALVSAAITLLEGVVEREDEGRWAPLEASQPLSQGTHLRTGNGRVAFTVAAGRGVVLEPQGELRLTALTAGAVQLSLVNGEVACAVSPLASDESFVVAAGPRFVRVVGTAFAVTRLPAAIRVEVEHGTVAVSDSLPGADALPVPGPGRLEAPDGVSLASLRVEALSGPAAAALVARPEWKWAQGSEEGRARLDIADLPSGALVSWGEGGWGPAPVQVWLSPGQHTLRARVTGEPERVATISLQLGAAPTRLAFPKPVIPRRRHVPAVDPVVAAALRAVERAHHRELTYCYEHALKRNPTVQGRIVLSLSLSPEGAVEEALASADDGGALPEELSACILESVRTWSFAPGAPSAFELPLSLQAH